LLFRADYDKKLRSRASISLWEIAFGLVRSSIMRGPLSVFFLPSTSMSTEKLTLLPSSSSPPPPQRHQTSHRSILTLYLFSFIGSSLIFLSRFASPNTAQSSHGHRLPLNGVNSTLKWSVCPDTPKNENYTYYCSLYSVPTNWLDPVKGETTEIFLRMLPADARKGKKLGTMLVSRPLPAMHMR
jgi:hypothetical protein